MRRSIPIPFLAFLLLLAAIVPAIAGPSGSIDSPPGGTPLSTVVAPSPQNHSFFAFDRVWNGGPAGWDQADVDLEWDPRLTLRGAVLIPAQVPAGQGYWKLVRGVWYAENEAPFAGQHHIFMDSRDQSGQRQPGVQIQVTSLDGGSVFQTVTTEAKPGELYAANFPMYVHAPAYRARPVGVADAVTNLGLGSIEQPDYNIHTSYGFVWQWTIAPSQTGTPTSTPTATIAGPTPTATATATARPPSLTKYLPVILWGRPPTPTPTATPSPTMTPSPTPTSTATPTATPTGPAGIYGRVQRNGTPAAGVALALWLWDGAGWSKYKTTTTAPDGAYLFSGLAALQPEALYLVYYGASSDPRFIYDWTGPNVVGYQAGTRVAGGDFDIANVALLSPAHGAQVGLPRTFTWLARGLQGDRYEWDLEDSGSGSYLGLDAGSGTAVTLGTLPPWAVYGTKYLWYVTVSDTPNGFGRSWAFYVTFVAPGQTFVEPESPAGGEGPVPPPSGGMRGEGSAIPPGQE